MYDKDVESKNGDLIKSGNDYYALKILNNTLNLLGHLLVSAVTIINLFYAFRNGLPLNATDLHIVLCVIGPLMPLQDIYLSKEHLLKKEKVRPLIYPTTGQEYDKGEIGQSTRRFVVWRLPRNSPADETLHMFRFQCLMAEGILYLSPHNGPSSVLTFVDKRRAHWGLQVLGSGLGLAGCFIKILDKEIHWNTLHGQFALVAMVFTVACFFNGLTSLYPNNLRFIPGSLSKLTHICFGIVAFAAATISLCYGFDKNGFRNWLNPATGLVTTTITFTALLLAIVIVNPILTFGLKSINVIKSR